jgi:hypothetical protein
MEIPGFGPLFGLVGTWPNLAGSFLDAGAVSPAAAKRFHPRSMFEEAAFARLLNDGIIRQAAPGRYWLDERALRERFPDFRR